jgi:hypothetical protein
MTKTNGKRSFSQRYYLLWLMLPMLLVATAVTARASFLSEDPDVLHAFSYISPQPNAEFVSAGTTIAVRPSWIQSNTLYETIAFTVSGTRSGYHDGEIKLADDQQTILFYPDEPFLANETVSVTIDLGEAETNWPNSYRYSFHIAPPAPRLPASQDLIETGWPQELQTATTGSQSPVVSYSFETAPADLPVFTVNAFGQDLGAGYIFLAYFNYAAFLESDAYLLILDNSGEPVYYERLHPLVAALDFKKQPNGLLTYFNPNPVQRKFLAMDNQYNLVDSYEAGNGYDTDLHDLQILDNDHALLMVHDNRRVDMSQLVPGGQPDATVVGCIIQELDSAKNVVFEWRSWDHMSILESNQDLTAELIRYIHCNSVEQDYDGHLLISSRHLDEVTKIDRNSGDILWRMGGPHNDFSFTNDPGFFHQHDARRLPNGNITIYDNGNFHSPPYSRGVEYAVNETAMTVTRVAEFRQTPDIFGPAMGNMQSLPGGNAVVGWGWSSNPIMTEFAPDGSVALTLSAPDTNGSYRAFRSPWKGDPTWAPKLIAKGNESTVDLYFSWNGATEITSYEIFGGQDPNNLAFLAKVPKQGFETTFNYAAPVDGAWHFQVMPIDKSGHSTQFSNRSLAVVGREIKSYLPNITGDN